MIDAVAVGELLIDFAMTGTGEDGYPVMEAHPGGAPANFLAAMAKRGCRTAFIGKVGRDAFGEKLIGTLRDAGIDTAGIVSDEACFTTLAFVTFDPHGERSFSFARKPGADTQLTYAECELSLIDEARLVHFGTLSLTDDPARGATKAVIQYAKKHGKLISFDPNLRRPLWHDPEDAKREMLWGLGEADIVKISDEEVAFLWGLTPEEGAEKIMREYGCRLVFVTCGAGGAVYANRNGMGRAYAPEGLKVIDTTGAGDIFGGTAAALLLKERKDPEAIGSDRLAFIAASACAAASLSCTKKGGIPSIPGAAEVAACVQKTR